MHSNLSVTVKRTILALAFASVAIGASAQKKYDTGATDTKIKIGNFVPYSGPASAYSSVGKSAGADVDKTVTNLPPGKLHGGTALSDTIVRADDVGRRGLG